ncbi:MAG TPA: thiamine phosphate synthase [Nitrospiraceae bacterium]|jgi:thiamine-phosphate pyrophosphorylase|nr:thiamine phosphate synthase [Nitrospiraceae bacterium]
MPQLESRLFLVTDRHQTNGRPLVPLLQRVLTAGVPAIQLRERDLSAKELVTLAREVQAMMASHRSQLLINDRIDVALALEGVGVHLRSNSLPVSVARQLLGAQRLLGISVHAVEEAVQVESQGVDYIVLGPIYETPTKQMFGPPLGIQTLEKACRLVRIPIIGIGGVTAARVREMRCAGAFGVAVITAVLGAVNVESAVRELLDAVTLIP